MRGISSTSNTCVLAETTLPEPLSTELNITRALAGAPTPCSPFVDFCAPQSGGAPDYAAVARTTPTTRVVLTFTASVHGAMSHVTETRHIGTDGRAAVMEAAVRAVLSHPSCVVVRLRGLYTTGRAETA